VLNKVSRRVRFAFSLLFATRERKKLIGRLLTVVTALITLSLAFLSFHSILGQFNQLSIGTGGTITTPEGVGVYWDSDCNSDVSFVDWGTVEPGSTKNVTIYIRNEGNDAVSLSIHAGKWNPVEASNYMTFSSDCVNQTVNPKEVVQTTLTLSTSLGIEGITDFSFDIVIDVSG